MTDMEPERLRAEAKRFRSADPPRAIRGFDEVQTRTLLERAAELPACGRQERVRILYLLGVTLEAMGNSGDARQVFERILAMDPGFRDVHDRLMASGKSSRT